MTEMGVSPEYAPEDGKDTKRNCRGWEQGKGPETRRAAQ